MPFPFPYKRAYPTAGFTLDLKELQTTGSMPAGSNQLTLTSNPGFLVGDRIIVELGGEAGGGLRGTEGVGGTWPSTSYADAAARIAATPADLTFVWQRDTAEIWRYVTGAWTQIYNPTYYVFKVVPRALVATITNIAGLVLTLSASSVVATNGASVHYDNAQAINAKINTGSPAVTANTLILPAGRFAVSDRLWMVGKTGLTMRGQGKDNTELFSPRGVPSIYIHVVQCTGILLRDFAYEGNARQNGFGFLYTANGLNVVTDTVVPSGQGYPNGLMFDSSLGCTAHDLRATDVWQKAVGTNFATDCWAYRCECIVTEPIRQYVQWMFQWADSTRGGMVDCVINSNYLTAGFETFRSVGTQLIRCVGRNASCSINAAGGWLLDAPDLTIEPNSQFDEASFSINNPIININTNVSPPTPTIRNGGLIRNPRIVQQGPINGAGGILTGVIVNAATPNVSIKGGYPSNPRQGGYIEHPNGTKATATGVISTGDNTLIEGIRVVGANAQTVWGNLKVGSTSTIKNCVADVIPAGGTQTGNQTNAAYIAGGGT